MTELSFTLFPFPDQNLPDIQITGQISRKNNLLTVHYSLTGSVEVVLFPSASLQPARKDDLWKATCFEFFLSIPNQPQYWEFNISPSGHWNVYKMDAYRRVGFREETQFQQLPFSYGIGAGYISVKVAVDLSPIIQAKDTIQAGVTSIIRTRDSHESYWALAHPQPQADFHLRESFVLKI